VCRSGALPLGTRAPFRHALQPTRYRIYHPLQWTRDRSPAPLCCGFCARLRAPELECGDNIVSSYPSDLIASIRSRCKALKSVKFHKPPPLPSEDIIETFLDVAFHASFQTEEGRRPGFRIVLYSPEEHSRLMKQGVVRPKYFENSFRLIPLDVVRLYSVAEVNRLAPAAEMKRLLICVTASPQSRPEPVLQIWSLLDTGENWWKFLHHEVGGGRPPPNFLTDQHLSWRSGGVRSGQRTCHTKNWPDSATYDTRTVVWPPKRLLG